MTELKAQQVGKHWVVPLLVLQDARYLVRLSITVDHPLEIVGGAIAVELKAHGQSLVQLAGPPPGQPLPFTALRGVNVHADFWFDVPAGVSPSEIVVTLGGQSASFDLTNVRPFIP